MEMFDANKATTGELFHNRFSYSTHTQMASLAKCILTWLLAIDTAYLSFGFGHTLIA